VLKDFLYLQGFLAAEVSVVLLSGRPVSTEMKSGVKGNWIEWLRRPGDFLGLVEEKFEQYGSGKEKTEV